MEPMRINFVLPEVTRAGGVRVVSIYAERLAQRGHRVTVIARPRRLPWRWRLRRGLKGQGFSASFTPEQSYFDELQGVDYRVIDRARPIVEADVPDADLTVATWWRTAYWIDRFSSSKGAKAFFLQHDERFVRGSDDEVIPTWKLAQHKILVAQWLDPVLRQHGVTGPLDVVPNAVDTELFNAPPRGKQPKPTVGLMYSDARFKGADLALAAFAKAKATCPELELVAFGKDDPYAEMPLPDGARFTQDPAQDQLRELYASCDAWLFASRCEGFGLPILEAMACRTPVIAAPAGAAPELVGQGGGVMVGPEDPDGMARAILDVCGQSDEDWRAMSDRAHATATGYTWDDATDAFERSLRTAINTQHAGGQAVRSTEHETNPGGDDGRKELACTR